MEEEKAQMWTTAGAKAQVRKSASALGAPSLMPSTSNEVQAEGFLL